MSDENDSHFINHVIYFKIKPNFTLSQRTIRLRRIRLNITYYHKEYHINNTLNAKIKSLHWDSTDHGCINLS